MSKKVYSNVAKGMNNGGNIAQTEKVPGKNQVKNNAGGYVFQITPWDMFKRFLIIGSQSNSYYADAKSITTDNVDNLIKCIQEDGMRVVNMIVEVSDKGLAAKNDPAIFALALVATYGNDDVKRYAFQNLNNVCRIGTHIMMFAEYCNSMRGWGRSLKNAVAKWYTSKVVSDAAYQMMKYKNRENWSHRDLLRLSHPKVDGDMATLFNWVTKPATMNMAMNVPETLEAFYVASKLGSMTKEQIIENVIKYRLPREVIPTEYLTDVDIWAALMDVGMPMTAMIRNLGNMTRAGLLVPLGKYTKMVIEKLESSENLKKARIHPINVLIALKTYQSDGNVRGRKGSSTWDHVPAIASALEGAFYDSFHYVEPTGKNILLALDVSSSMSSACMGTPILTDAEISAAFAMTTVRTEKNVHVVAFNHSISTLSITKNMSLKEVLRKIQNINFGGTDCSLPMVYAKNQKLDVDCFIVHTDNETWCGKGHPYQTLKNYREAMGKDSKSIVMATRSTSFTIADPRDKGMLDIASFSSDVPSVVSGFIKGDF